MVNTVHVYFTKLLSFGMSFSVADECLTGKGDNMCICRKIVKMEYCTFVRLEM